MSNPIEAPERIWLLQHDGEQRCWCDEPDPSGLGHEADATPYVRADIHAALKAENEEQRERLIQFANAFDAGYAAAERALAERAGGVKVKALEWSSETACALGAKWMVWPYSDPLNDGQGNWMWQVIGAAPHASGRHHTEEEAKAAAQADYERRILSTLTTEPAAPEAGALKNEQSAPEGQQPVAEAVEPSGNTGELIDKMAEAIRGDTASDDTPWATLSEDRKIGWRGDAERALAVVKECLTARRPAEQAVTDERLRQAVEFVARWCWRTDPPNANNKLTDAERLSAIKYHPDVKAFGEPHAALAQKEAGE